MSAYDDIRAERARQRERWGDADMPDGTGARHYAGVAKARQVECDQATREGRCTFAMVLREEVAEALAETDPVRLRDELVQVAAVAVRWIEAIDRRAK